MENVLVIGSGGREHALAWKLAQSEHVGKVYVAPGNGGTAQEEKCENVPVKINPKEGFADAVEFAKTNKVALTVVGPEQPLVDGIATEFLCNGLRIFGPGREGALLEGSKERAKRFMMDNLVPTPAYAVFDSYDKALDYVEGRLATGSMIYIKASGLAAGKGALPGRTRDEALESLTRIMVNKEFGGAGDKVVVEQFLEGEETSCMALINALGGVCVPLLPSQDHKKLLKGDEGPNTGGMGAYAPTRLITPKLDTRIHEQILTRTVNGLKFEDTGYTGFIYPGLMVTKEGPKVLEYNVRMGDPEAQPVLSLLTSDLYEDLNAVTRFSTPTLRWRDGYAVCVVLASKGYPVTPEKGKKIYGLGSNGNLDMEGVKVFHAGTNTKDGIFYTSGGRVLGVTGYGETIPIARDRAYAAVDRIHFDGMQFRTDIGLREFMRL